MRLMRCVPWCEACNVLGSKYLSTEQSCPNVGPLLAKKIADFLGFQSNRIVYPYGNRSNFHFMMFQAFSYLHVLLVSNWFQVSVSVCLAWGIVQPCESNSWAIGSTSPWQWHSACCDFQRSSDLKAFGWLKTWLHVIWWLGVCLVFWQKTAFRWWHPQRVWARLLAWGPQVFCTQSGQDIQDIPKALLEVLEVWLWGGHRCELHSTELLWKEHAAQ